MASSCEENFSVENVILCSICFEKFKTPRYLPCTHSFCHGCLSSYIVSSCKSTDSRLGFNCPLCREYIACNGAFDKPEELAGLFPVNEILEKIIEKPNQGMCDACFRDNEEVKSTHYCIACMESLCELCTKYHRKQLMLKDHKVYKITEMKPETLGPVLGNTCPKHRKERVKVYCHDHGEPCCTICGCTEHRKCNDVTTIESAVKTLRDRCSFGVLLLEVQQLKKILSDAKEKEENNITELDEALKKTTEMTERNFNEVVKYLENLKNEHLKNVSVAVKESKEKISRCVDKLSDGIQCVNYCEQNIERAKASNNDSEILLKYYSAKQVFNKMKFREEFSKKQITISINDVEIFKRIKQLKCPTELELSESEDKIDTGNTIKTVTLSLVKELDLAESAFSGTFLSDGSFMVSTQSKNCFIFDNWALIKKFDKVNKIITFGIFQSENNIFVSGHDSISVISFQDYQHLKVILLNDNLSVFGMDVWKGNFYTACLDKIVKIDSSGKLLKEYPTPKNVVNVMILKSGHIVYSSWSDHTVTSISNEGEIIWTYWSPNLKFAYGLDKNTNEHIFVAGKETNNIHVLSSTGVLLRVFDNIPKPIFMKVDKQSNICCVCSDWNKLKVFEMK
ncbi:probable E3 ubiquitin-protein ligase MID2 [Saccostrea cucullata]|uniref:probable E3 ubiquitin-protein ligase MID2 n=1 Tax=Saccostrea cuccullata TaxID=36930 RepID=UPI002ED48F42